MGLTKKGLLVFFLARPAIKGLPSVEKQSEGTEKGRLTGTILAAEQNDWALFASASSWSQVEFISTGEQAVVFEDEFGEYHGSIPG
jgi:hypothetical protein